MANRRDGGRVILGVEDGDPANSVGASQAQAESWTTFDDVADQISKYADPMVEFSSSQVQLDGKRFVVIDVDEFREVPVLCKREYQANGGSVILRKGACYVRSSSGKIETREVGDSDEMRVLVDLATEKRLRAHIETTVRAGGVIMPAGDSESVTDEAAKFRDELGELA